MMMVILYFPSRKARRRERVTGEEHLEDEPLEGKPVTELTEIGMMVSLTGLPTPDLSTIIMITYERHQWFEWNLIGAWVTCSVTPCLLCLTVAHLMMLPTPSPLRLAVPAGDLRLWLGLRVDVISSLALRLGWGVCQWYNLNSNILYLLASQVLPGLSHYLCYCEVLVPS